jgi:hypothetical protein
MREENRFQLRPHSNNFAVVLVSEFTALCTSPKGPPLVAGLGWVVGVSALGTAIGAGSLLFGFKGVALALFAI